MRGWIKKYWTFDGIMLGVSLSFIVFILTDPGFNTNEQLFGGIFFAMVASISYANI